MSFTEGKRLAAFSAAVRGSTIKRLRLVPQDGENWRVSPNSMSFADLARHLIDADEWLFRMLETKNEPPMRGGAGLVSVAHRDEYLRLIEELERTGQRRRDVFEELAEEDLRERYEDARFGGAVTGWWVIVRGNLDHEIHHRGQISAYLRMVAVGR